MTSSDSMKTNSTAVASSGSDKPPGDSSGVVQTKPAEAMMKSDEAVIYSVPAKTSVQTGVSSGDGGLKNPDGVPTAPSTPVKPVRKTRAVSGISIGGKARAPTGISIGSRAKSRISAGDKGKGVAVDVGGKGKGVVSDQAVEVIAFRDVTLGVHQGELQFRLIHFWEAWNNHTKVLIGVEMLLIDREGTVVQGYIPSGKVRTYVPHMRAGDTYRLRTFYGSVNKPDYRVADGDVTVTFCYGSELSELVDSSINFPMDRFRFHGFNEFDRACDMKGDLYDYIGHIKLVNGELPSGSILLDETRIAAARRVDIHVQNQDEPVLKLCLWDKAASEFWRKFRASGGDARVILVTTLNPKRYGALSLSSMSASRVFLDDDVEDTRNYLDWLKSNQDVANRVKAEAVVKPEPATLGELFAYMKNASAKVAWFECTATVDDVVNGSNWYYIGCGECHTKATKGSTTLMCKKCGKNEIVGVAQYLTKISVLDQKDQAFFVLLGEAGEQLFGRKASVLVENYFEANDGVGYDAIVPVPEVMLNTVGQTQRFIVKISSHNLQGKTHTLTVTKVLPPEEEAPEDSMGDSGHGDAGDENGDQVDGPVKREAGGIDAGDAKRVKSG